MKKMPLWKEAFAGITLGLLVGWPIFCLLLIYPTLIYLSIYDTSMELSKTISRALVVVVIALSAMPMRPDKEWEAFMYGWIFSTWRDYFDFEIDSSDFAKTKKPGQQYIFFEFPHGIFPMGQFVSVSIIRDITERMIYGLAADVVFFFPIVRQVMAWVGTYPATRKSITKIMERGCHIGVQAGGIAEMYLMNHTTEKIYLRKRKGTVKAAIQEGFNIVPVYCFGNTRLFHVPGNKEGDSWLAKASRKARASIVFFYGRFFLPIPLRHPIKIGFGEVIEVEKNPIPTDAEIDEYLEKVIAGITKVYETKKPVWETRPLVIT